MLYDWHAFFFIVYKLFGWFGGAQKFYIEHIISNLNWPFYIFGTWWMIVAVIDDNTWNSYLGLFLWLNFAWMFSYGEFRLGTDAIRYLDNNYWMDPRLLPSMLYIFGLLEH